MWKSYWLIASISLVVVGCGTAVQGSGPPALVSGGCPVTRAPAPAFVPPAPYPPQPPAAYAGQFWYGTADLWTMLRSDGTWSGLPKGTDGYSQKLFWWRAGYVADEEPSPDLTVTGSRLDGDAGRLVASTATNASADFGQAMLVGAELPTPGCWEITGHYRGHDLSFRRTGGSLSALERAEE